MPSREFDREAQRFNERNGRASLPSEIRVPFVSGAAVDTGVNHPKVWAGHWRAAL